MLDDHTFLCDTGASCHLTNSLEGMSDMVKSDCQIKIGSGKQLSSKIVGTKNMVITHKDGSTMDITLENCRYVPDLWVSLFSVNKALASGYNLANDGLKIILTKGKSKKSALMKYSSQIMVM